MRVPISIQVQAREVARNNNCTPTKVDTYQQSLSSEGTTTYQLTCAAPETRRCQRAETGNRVAGHLQEKPVRVAEAAKRRDKIGFRVRGSKKIEFFPLNPEPRPLTSF